MNMRTDGPSQHQLALDLAEQMYLSPARGRSVGDSASGHGARRVGRRGAPAHSVEERSVARVTDSGLTNSSGTGRGGARAVEASEPAAPPQRAGALTPLTDPASAHDVVDSDRQRPEGDCEVHLDEASQAEDPVINDAPGSVETSDGPMARGPRRRYAVRGVASIRPWRASGQRLRRRAAAAASLNPCRALLRAAIVGAPVVAIVALAASAFRGPQPARSATTTRTVAAKPAPRTSMDRQRRLSTKPAANAHQATIAKRRRAATAKAQRERRRREARERAQRRARAQERRQAATAPTASASSPSRDPSPAPAPAPAPVAVAPPSPPSASPDRAGWTGEFTP